MQDDSARPAAGELLLPVTWGDFLDRLTIQELRAERLPDPEARTRASSLLVRMQAMLEERGPLPSEAQEPLNALRAVNAALWDKESAVRQSRMAMDEHGGGDHTAQFCALAQEILAGNERRAALKKAIDQALGHPYEDKHY